MFVYTAHSAMQAGDGRVYKENIFMIFPQLNVPTRCKLESVQNEEQKKTGNGSN